MEHFEYNHSSASLQGGVATSTAQASATTVTPEEPALDDSAFSPRWLLETLSHLWKIDGLGARELLIRAVLDSLAAHTAVLDADGTIAPSQPFMRRFLNRWWKSGG